MDEKDKQIERLFDDYASSLEPNEKLSVNALQKMRGKNSKPKKSRAPVWIGAVATCAAVAVVVFSVMSFWGGNGSAGGHSNNTGSTGSMWPSEPNAPSDSDNSPAIDAPNSQQSYGVNDVRSADVNGSFAASYIDTSKLSDAQIVNEKYYAYYLNTTDEFVYFKAEINISYNGGNIQMNIIAESSMFTNEELNQEYSAVIKGSDYNFSTANNNGEYNTIAYCKQGGYKYYVSATGDADGAENIAKNIIGIKN